MTNESKLYLQELVLKAITAAIIDPEIITANCLQWWFFKNTFLPKFNIQIYPCDVLHYVSWLLAVVLSPKFNFILYVLYVLFKFYFYLAEKMCIFTFL